MDNIREISYKISRLIDAEKSTIEKLESDFSGVKGVIGVKLDVENGIISYALDQWASDYDILCKLDEICEKCNLEIDYDGLEEKETVVEETTTIESEDGFDNSEDDFEEERALQKFFDKEALCSLYELFDFNLDMQ